MSVITRKRRRQEEEEPEFPCLQCGREVRPRQQALECDSCSRWQHRLCNTGITIQQYRAAMEDGMDWTCSHCGIQVESRHDEVASLTSHIEPIGESSRLSSVEQSTHHSPPLSPNSLHSEDGRELDLTHTLISHNELNVSPMDYTDYQGIMPIGESSRLSSVEQSTHHSPPLSPNSLHSEDGRELDLTHTLISHNELNVSPMDYTDYQGIMPIGESSRLSSVEQSTHHSPPLSPNSLHSDDGHELDLTHTINHNEQPLNETYVVDSGDDSSIIEQPIMYNVIQDSSQRGRRVLVDSHGYSYGVKRSYENKTIWRCSVRNKEITCNCNIIQRGDDFTPGHHRHIHPPKEAEFHRRQLHKQLKMQAKSDPRAGGLEIAQNILLEYGLVYPAKAATLTRMANRVREADRPKEPRALDFELHENFLPEDFFVADVNRGGHRSLIFATAQQLEMLSQARMWFIDATFQVVRQPFYQLLIIHAYHENGDSIKQVPLAFILMSSKRKSAYRSALFELQTALPRPAAVEDIMVDFEAALWKVLPRIFPQARLLGCNFHWKQAVFRKVQALGLAVVYSRDEEKRFLLQQVMALPFLPIGEVFPAFERLRQQSDTPVLDELFNYVEATWLRNATWPIPAWCMYGKAIRTNNDAEGYNNRLRRNASGKNMGPYQLAGLLHQESLLADLTVRMVDRQLITRRQRRLTMTMQGRIFRAWEAHRDGRKTTEELLRVCALTYDQAP